MIIYVKDVYQIKNVSFFCPLKLKICWRKTTIWTFTAIKHCGISYAQLLHRSSCRDEPFRAATSLLNEPERKCRKQISMRGNPLSICLW